MAPKRKKARLTRMDAAVDHMGVFGFQSQLVRKTVRNLLKVYGDDGWPFIEENAYKVLVDTLLEDEAEERNNLLKDASEDAVDCEDAEITEAAASLLSFKEPVLQECVLGKTTLHSGSSDNVDHSANEVNHQDYANTSLSLATCDVVPTRRVKSCNGWISDTDDDDDDDGDGDA